jgi:hypothetical protein
MDFNDIKPRLRNFVEDNSGLIEKDDTQQIMLAITSYVKDDIEFGMFAAFFIAISPKEIPMWIETSHNFNRTAKIYCTPFFRFDIRGWEAPWTKDEIMSLEFPKEVEYRLMRMVDRAKEKL